MLELSNFVRGLRHSVWWWWWWWWCWYWYRSYSRWSSARTRANFVELFCLALNTWRSVNVALPVALSVRSATTTRTSSIHLMLLTLSLYEHTFLLVDGVAVTNNNNYNNNNDNNRSNTGAPLHSAATRQFNSMMPVQLPVCSHSGISVTVAILTYCKIAKRTSGCSQQSCDNVGKMSCQQTHTDVLLVFTAVLRQRWQAVLPADVSCQQTHTDVLPMFTAVLRQQTDLLPEFTAVLLRQRWQDVLPADAYWRPPDVHCSPAATTLARRLASRRILTSSRCSLQSCCNNVGKTSCQ